MRVIDAHRPVVARHFAKRDDEHESSQWCGSGTAPRRAQSAGRSMRWGIAGDHGTGRRIWGEPQIWAWLSFDRSRVTRASACRPRKPAVLNLVGSNCEGLERPVRDKREASVRRARGARSPAVRASAREPGPSAAPWASCRPAQCGDCAGTRGGDGQVYLELSERDAGGRVLAKAVAIWAHTAERSVPEFERATGATLGGS